MEVSSRIRRVAWEEDVRRGELSARERALYRACYTNIDPGLKGLNASTPRPSAAESSGREFIGRLTQLAEANIRGPRLPENRAQMEEALTTWHVPDLARLALANGRHQRLRGRVMLAARRRNPHGPLAFEAWRIDAECQGTAADSAMLVADTYPPEDDEWPDSMDLCAQRVWRLACLAGETVDDETTRCHLRIASLIRAMTGLDRGGAMVMYLGLVDGGTGYEAGMETYVRR